MAYSFSILITLFLFFLTSFVWSADPAKKEEEQKDEGWVRFIGHIDTNYQYNQIKAPWQYDPISSHFNLSEIIFGLEWKPTELILVHLDSKTTGNVKSGVNVGPGDIYGQIMFSQKVPIFIKGGYFELPNQVCRKEEITPTDSWVIESSYMVRGAAELGVQVDFFRTAFGFFESRSSILAANGTLKNDSTDVADFYAYATGRPILGPVELLVNLSFTSHVGDSLVGGSGLTNYFNKIPAFVSEAKAKFYNFQTMFCFFYRLKNDDTFYTKYALRGEMAYSFKDFKVPIIVGGIFDYRKISPFVKIPQAQSEARVGGVLGYVVEEVALVNFATEYKFAGRKEFTLTLQLVIDFPDQKFYYK